VATDCKQTNISTKLHSALSLYETSNLHCFLKLQHKPFSEHHLPFLIAFVGRYLEIFARKNNLRNFWVSVGNEVTGTGLPEEDMDALRERATIPNAVYGRATNTRGN
jgi:hypothetical protein